MSNKSKDGGVDRRDFMIGAAVSVSASAVLGTNLAEAKTQEAAPGGAVYTGDVIQGEARH
jgi:hypothetical protein